MRSRTLEPYRLGFRFESGQIDHFKKLKFTASQFDAQQPRERVLNKRKDYILIGLGISHHNLINVNRFFNYTTKIIDEAN